MIHKPQHLFIAAGLTASALLFTNCVDEDYGYEAEDIKYAKAYESFFGKLPADKNWDLSSSTNHYHYGASTTTRANGVTPTGNELVNSETGEYQVKDSYWTVPQKTYDWMKAALKEGKDNRYLGSPFVLQLPDNDFAIIPIFQGKSSIMSELEVKINGYQITKVWTRSENIQVKDSKFSKFADSEGWMNIGFYDGYSSYQQDDMKSQGNACLVNGNRDWSKLPMHPSFTDESEAVRSKPIYFRAKDKIGKSDKGFMYLSLHNIDKAWAWWNGYNSRWDGNNEWTTIGHRLTSINPQGHMLALNVPSQYRPAPSELPNICEDGTTKPSQVIFVSCEDANGTGTDHDVNDVAFLIIGYPNAPTIVPTTEVIKKRYMCEDLGGTYDYDFNDIVVDVTQTQKYSVNAQPDDLENYDGNVAGDITIKDMVPEGCPIQTAKITRLCGTIPLQVQIGSFMFPKIRNPRNNNNADGDGTDGKYDTRRTLAGNWGDMHYYLYNHTECPNCCHNHENIPADNSTTKGRIEYAHHNFTRGTTEGWNPNEEQIIPCHTWDPDANNIVIYADWGYRKEMYTAGTITGGTYDQSTNENVKHSNPFPENSEDFADFASGKKFAVQFPETGKYPYIIATDQDVPWMNEGEHIPDGWVHGDMTARSDGGSNHDLIGNSFYMENYGAGDHWEGYIWSGDVTGLAGSTGVTFANPSAELNAMNEAFGTLNGGHRYYLLHVYADVPAGEMAYIGLYNPETWKPILDTDPDGYLVKPIDQRLHRTELGVDGLQCTTIYLTQEQRDYILAHGLTVASRTDGVRIKKVTTARPCLYDSQHTTGTSLDGGFIVKIDKSKVDNGWIQSDESERQQEIITAESGKTLSSEEIAHNEAEPDRVKVPFEKHQFISGSIVTLTAIGKTVDDENSYRVTGWTVSNTTDFTVTGSNPIAITCNNTVGWAAPKEVTVYPTFVAAKNPKLKWEETPTEASKTITLALNGSKPYKLYANSLNLSTGSKLDQFGGNTTIVGAEFDIENGKHVIKLTPNAVGETTFTIYQKDGEYNSENYGVSGELKLTVKVIESMPTANFSMDKTWIYRWNGTAANAYILDDNTSLSLNYNITTATSNATAKEVLYGDANGWGHAYADLSEATKLIVEVAQGDIELIFNRENQWEGETKVDASHAACNVIYNGSTGAKAYVIDLTKLRSNGVTRLNTIRERDAAVATKITSIKTDHNSSTVVDTWKSLKAKIASADKPAYSTLFSHFYEWTDESATAGVVGRTEANYVWLQDEASKTTATGQVIYGNTSSHSRHYVDLSTATVLVVTVPKLNRQNNGDTELCKEIFFQFNKEYGTNGYGSAKQINLTDRDICSVVNDGSTRKIVIDLDAFKNKYGVNHAHLNAINTTWNDQDIGMYITDAKVNMYNSKPEDLYKMSFPVDFTTSMMHTWSNGAVTGTPNDCALNIGTASDVVLGTGGIYGPDTYVDLSSAKWMKITMSSYNELRFWFNKTSSDNSNYLTTSSPYIYHIGNSIYVDLEGIKNANGGEVHLNGIKSSSSGTNVTVTSVKLDAYTDPSGGDQPVEMTLTTVKNEEYSKIVSVSGLSIWNDVLKSGGISEYTGLKFTIKISNSGINDFYIYNNQSVNGSGEKKFSTQLKQGNDWINGASFNSTTREVTYTLSKVDFTDNFQGISPQSDIYFGGNCPLVDKITVQVIR